MIWAPGSGSNCSSTDASPFATTAAAADGDEESPSAVSCDDHQAADEHDSGEHSRADDDRRDDPARQRVEAREQLLTELHQGVAEQPLHDAEDDEHGERDDEPKDVGG